MRARARAVCSVSCRAATDGVWDHLDNETAVRTVGRCETCNCAMDTLAFQRCKRIAKARRPALKIHHRAYQLSVQSPAVYAHGTHR